MQAISWLLALKILAQKSHHLQYRFAGVYSWRKRAEGVVDGAQATLVTQDMGDLGSIPLFSWWNMNLTLHPLREH